MIGKTIKVVLYTAAGAICLIIIILLMKFLATNRLRSQIPQLSDSLTLSQPVREQISDALKKARHDPSAGNLGMLGMVYHSSANYEQAAQCYALAARKGKSGWIWNYYLGYLNMEMGRSEAVIKNFKRVLRKNPDMNLAWYYIGSEYKNLRQNELAEEAFGKITAQQKKTSSAKETTRRDHFPLSAYAMFQLSRIYFETGRNELAEKTLKDIIKDNHSFGPAYRLLGNLSGMKGDSALSKHYSDRAGDLMDFSPPVDTLVDRLVLLSRSELFLLKKIDEAERSIYSEWTLKVVNNALKYLPDNKYLISKAVKNFLWMNLDKQAINYTDQHIGYFQDNFAEMNNTGLSFFMKGIYPQAIKYYTRASDLEPDNIEILKNLAISYWSMGDKKKSYEILDKIIEKNKNNPDILADVANTLFFNFRESDKAISMLTRLKKTAPTNPKVQKLAAGVAEKDGKYREAITLYESSFNGDPKDLITIRYLGNLLVRQEMWDKAIRHYRKALEYHPNDPDLLEKLGTLLVRCPDWSLRKIEEGKEYSERAFIHISSRPGTLVSAGKSLAFAYAMLGDKQNAITAIKQTISIGRQESIPRADQAELENLYKTFQAMKD